VTSSFRVFDLFGLVQRWIVRIYSCSPTEIKMVDLHRAIEHVLSRRHETQRVSHPPGPRRTEDKPLSDCSISHMPFSQTLRGSFVECSGVCVVTVNWKRQSPLEH